MIEYQKAEEAEQIATELINLHHTHLIPAQIGYLMKDGSVGKEILGQASKCDPRTKFLTGLDFIVTLSNDFWETATDAQKKALVDHELCHCGAEEDEDGEITWVLRRHDYEEFRGIIDRHGFWRGVPMERDVASAMARQLELPIGKLKMVRENGE